MFNKRIIGLSVVLLTSLATAPVLGEPRVDYQAELAPAPKAGDVGYFQPPAWDKIPNDAFGEAVKRGYNIFTNTQEYAADYVGNGLNCSNCHLDSGRRPNSAPLWAAWVQYPKYRKKNDKVNTIEDRMQGCFTYSMDGTNSKKGHAPEAGSDILRNLQAYMFWLAEGVPTGAKMPGRGYPVLNKPAQGPDRNRGEKVYAQQCAICHGDNGQGTKAATGQYTFPPLWGPDSYNWGAGMHRVNTAAGFIKANMPLGKPNTLSDQDAWDVAAYINSQERPADPRDKGDIKATAERFHKHDGYYGKEIDGHQLGQGAK